MTGERTLVVGVDDTDTVDSPGTNQLARRIANDLPAALQLRVVLRHQLFLSPLVPYTSRNGSASLLLRGTEDDLSSLQSLVERHMRDFYVEGSDPAYCIATHVPDAIHAFGVSCKTELQQQRTARELAASSDIILRGLGGTEDGVIGALAAVGLASRGDDGRVIHMPGWEWPDNAGGLHAVADVIARGVDSVRDQDTGSDVFSGWVDVGRRLRPSWRGGRAVLFVRRASEGSADFTALKLD